MTAPFLPHGAYDSVTAYSPELRIAYSALGKGRRDEDFPLHIVSEKSRCQADSHFTGGFSGFCPMARMDSR